ncbi:MAG: electron transfer flavoprotein subunit alpha/FixB family protein [Deltaproteobacteria bacterium]|nr:electron transfer flavoprotein subunit alpha/FixB family protein [Deltaproteobacteria bacterium]
MNPVPQHSILALVDLREGEVLSSTADAVALALSLAAGGEKPLLGVLGKDPQAAAREAARLYGLPAAAVSGPALGGAAGRTRALALARLARQCGARWVCLPGTPLFADVAPGLAVYAGGCCIPAVEGVEAGESGPAFTRSAAGGKYVVRVEAKAFPAVLTASAGSFAPPPENTGEAGEVIPIDWGDRPADARSLGMRQRTVSAPGLSLARVVVAVGRGMGAAENLEQARRLASLFSESALAGSRPACDMGWLPHSRQVGVTGQTVAPALYFACGISGAFQHVAGMRGSRFVVAVNRDKNAPIFRVADVGVVEDALSFLPLFCEVCEERK